MPCFVKLAEYDIQFLLRGSIKSQVLPDFLVEFTSPIIETDPHVWMLYAEGSSNLKGSGAWVVLEGPSDLIIEQSMRFKFKASNKQAEDESLIAEMTLA